MSRAKWKHSEGSKPYTVTVYEREPGGILYARAWDPTAMGGKGNYRYKSLGHRDKQRAKRYAVAQAAKLLEGAAEVTEARITLAQVFSLYEKYQTPSKTPGQQKADTQRIELWTRVLGARIDPHEITPQQWQSFIKARSSGAIDARGNPVPDEADDEGKPRRQPVRARTVEADCQWLRFAFNWAAQWPIAPGRTLLRYNPLRASTGRKKKSANLWAVPTEKNPRRVLATTDFFEAIRKAAESHTMELRPKGKPSKESEKVPSYLPELLDIAEGTARRISAICQLRYSDLRIDRTQTAPYGAIVWPGESDKEGRAWIAPMSPRVRAAIDRILKQRPGIGSAYLFPAPGDPSKPISRRLATDWFHDAEELAGLDHVTGRGWHSLRRKWATERKHLPDVDVMAAGGWRSLEALKRSYQQADEASVLAVVLGGGELREAQ